MVKTRDPFSGRSRLEMEGGRRPTVPRWFVPLLQPGLWKSAAGGRGAGKSHEFAELRMACSLPWYPQEPVRIASARETKVAIKESVKVVIDQKIRDFGLADEFDSYEFHINNTRTGSHMWFPGFERRHGFLPVGTANVPKCAGTKVVPRLFQDCSKIVPTIP